MHNYEYEAWDYRDLKDKTMADKLMNIPNYKITRSVDYNKMLKRLDTKLYELTNQNSDTSLKICEAKVIIRFLGLV